jgi:hypothetical protein
LFRLPAGHRTANIQMTADNALSPPGRSMRRRDLPGGMVKLEVILSPDEVALVLAAIDRAREVIHTQADDVSTETRAVQPMTLPRRPPPMEPGHRAPTPWSPWQKAIWPATPAPAPAASASNS